MGKVLKISNYKLQKEVSKNIKDAQQLLTNVRDEVYRLNRFAYEHQLSEVKTNDKAKVVLAEHISSEINYLVTYLENIRDSISINEGSADIIEFKSKTKKPAA